MLRKLLNYDMRYVWRVWRFVAPIALILSFVGGICVQVLNLESADPNYDIMQVLFGFGFFFCLLGIGAFYFVGSLMSHYRFYKNLFTDEGYLTFTLPISRAKIFGSKTLNSYLWNLWSGIVILICVLIICFVADAQGFGEFWRGFWYFLQEGWQYIGAWLAVYIVLLVLILLSSIWLSVSLIQFCITVGAIIAKKYKLLAGIGIYYVGNMILSFFMQIAMIIGLLSVMDALGTLIRNISVAETHPFLTLILFLISLVCCTISCLIHFITLDLVERKLNLA